MLAQCRVAHEQAEVAAARHLADDLLVRGRCRAGEREHLVRRGDVVGCAGKQVQRHVDPLQVHASPPDLQRSAEEEVVAEQVAHDPQIELAGDVLGVLEPVLELGVTRDMRGIADAVQQGELPLHLGARLDQDEAGEHVLALQHTAAGRDQRFVEAQVTTGSEMAKHLVDHRLAGVEVDRCPRDRERVHALGRERGVEGGEPAALAVAGQE